MSKKILNDSRQIESNDYKDRSYLSAIEAAKFLGLSVSRLHYLVKNKIIKAFIATSGQMRFNLIELKRYETKQMPKVKKNEDIQTINIITINETVQKLYVKSALQLDDLPDESIHLMVTSYQGL